MGWQVVSLVIRLVEALGRTNQLVDRRSVGGRTRVEVPAGRSLLGVRLPSGFGKRPERRFRTGRGRENRRLGTFRK